MRKSKNSRRGLATLEVVIVTGLTLPMAALIYITLEAAMEIFFFMIGNLVGCPFL
jgi:hypothetical protein